MPSVAAASADVDLPGRAAVDGRADERWFPRLIGVLILGLAGAGAVLMLLATLATGPAAGVAPTRGFLFGVWSVLYATEAPTPRVAVAAIGLAVLFAAGVALLERRITNQSRRSVNVGTNPLAPKLVMARTEGFFAGRVTVTVLIPMFEIVHAETDGGALTLCIGEGTPNIDWRNLTVGQRIRCTVETGPATRVLNAKVLAQAGTDI